MNEIEKIKQEIEALQEKLKGLEDAARWEPKGGSHHLLSAYSFDTCEARDKAEKDLDRYYRLYKLAEELNEGWEPNWDDETQSKWLVGYNNSTQRYYAQEWYCCDQTISSIYFKDKATVERAIRIIEVGGLEG